MAEMTFFGALRAATRKAAPQRLSAAGGERGWSHLFSDTFTGSWQQDVTVDRGAVLANWAVFSCITLIAGDIGKVSLSLVERTSDGIWEQGYSAAPFARLIRKPNRYQTRQQFIEHWLFSKLSTGNAYILKQRGDGGVVVALHVLDPGRVQPLVAPDGSVYYQLQDDTMSGVRAQMPAVPASEVMHDRMNCLFHPLVGLSPIYASGLSATQGLKIQQNSAKFFENMSRPSGILAAPGKIDDADARRLKEDWEKNFSGGNIGRVAVLGSDLKYNAMTVNATDAQMVEQLKMSAEMVCSTFHVPAFKIGAGVIPAGQKVEDLNQIYYSDCLHALMDAIQTLLVEGLELDTGWKERAVRFELDDLLKMDTATFVSSLKTAIDAAVMAPNEARKRLNLKPVPGGDAPLSQQQNFSLEALAKRDALDDPFNAGPFASGKSGLGDLPGLPGADGRDGRDGKAGEPGRDAAQIDILPALDETREYPRGTYAAWRGGTIRSTRTTEPIEGKDPLSCGWAICTEGIANIEVRQTSERDFTFTHTLTSGAVHAHHAKLAVVLDAGPYRLGMRAQKGDAVTWGGSLWIAKQATTEAPGSDAKHWRLAVKRGRDGKDGTIAP